MAIRSSTLSFRSRRSVTVDGLMPSVMEALPRRSARTYKPGLRFLEARMGAARVDSVTAVQLRQLRDELHAASGNQTVRRAQDTGRALRTYDPGAFGQGAAENFVTAVRFFFRYAIDAGLLEKSPAEAVSVPRRHPSLRRPLTSEELTQIWDVAVGTGMDPELDGMILTVLRHTACRRSGLLGLALTHLDLDGGRILLTEKYSDTRALPMAPRLIADLLDFAHARGSGRPSDPVFRYRNGDPLTRRRFNSLFDRVDRHTTFSETLNVSAHWIRHTTLADITAVSDLRVAAAFAGHSPEELGVTGIYTKVTFDDLHDAYWAVFGAD